MNENDRDLAKKSGGMELHALERVIEDAENEPKWRESANQCADYYDHKQLSPDRIARSEKTGEPNVVVNLIQRTLNGALGQEAKTRLNWKVTPDSETFGDVAAVLNESLHQAQREARTDMAISEAYASMLKTGIGWVMVDRDPNPLAYPYRVRSVHRNQVWWDWRAKESDLSDAAWMLMQRWADVDEVATLFPEHREILSLGLSGGPIADVMARSVLTSRDNFESIHQVRRSFSVAEEEWLDNATRKRVRLYQVFYKRHQTVVAMVVGTKRVRFNPKNPYHVAMVQRGAAQLIKGPGYEIRRAMFAGPFRLYDEPMPGQKFPLIPFICYRCDDDNSPYGLVHGMIQPQDEFNERRSRLLWLLKAKQVIVESDALDTKYNNLVDLATEVMRPDAMFVLNPNRRNANGLQINMHQQLSAEQANVMNDAKILIQDQPGLYGPQFGGNRVGAESGFALNSLMEQSVTSLGETSDNYRMSRQSVGDCLVGVISEDLTQPNMQVPIGTGKRRRVVVLNGQDEAGLPINPIEDAQVRVGLGDVPTTTAYKAQQQAFLTQALQSVGANPAAQAILLPALLEAGDLEHREAYAKWLRKQHGIPEPTDMADEQAMEAMDQQANQAKAQAMQLQARVAEAEAASKESAAALNQAKGVLTQMQSLLTHAQAVKVAAETDAMDAANDDSAINDALQEALQG